MSEVEWEPTRWWRVVAQDGSLWCETSDETEARDSMRPGDVLQRVYKPVTDRGVSDLAEFLLARIAEDEEVARAATPGPWYWDLDSLQSRALVEGLASNGPGKENRKYRRRPNEPRPRGADADSEVAASSGMEWEWPAIVARAVGHEEPEIEISPADADHIARHDPARVLAECEAKRRIVNRYRVCEPNYDEGNRLETRVLDWAMRLLALPYADHPDYREEWRR